MNLRQTAGKKWVKRVAAIAVLAIFITTLSFVLIKPKVQAQTFITSGTSWSVPTDWNSTNNTIEVIGGGGGAGGGFKDSSGSGGGGGGGGGAGGYSRVSNVALTPGSTVTIAVGAAGSGGIESTNGTAGGDTYLCNSTSGCTSITDSSVIVGAKGGGLGQAGSATNGGTGGTGGAAGSGVGTTKFSGGTGATPTGPVSAAGSGGGGGGGAAGLNASGNNGLGNATTTAGGLGGQGDGTFGGAGGTGNGGAGSIGTEYDGSHGSGGGAAGGNGINNGSGSPGGLGGAYGAAGGGGGGNGNKNGNGGTGGNGNQGLIRVTYNYTTQTDYRWRLDDGAENSGTSLASQNTAATITSAQVARLRVALTNQGDATSYSYRLEYAVYNNGCGSWTAVPNTATTEPFNMYNTSNYSDQAASTNVSTGSGVLSDPGGYTFTAGKLVKSPSNTASSVSTAASTFTELEYAIQPNSNAVDQAYCFRLTNAGTPLDSYQRYPILNINYVPSTPTIYSVVDGSTSVPRLPVFQLKSTDKNNDYLKYVVEVCAANSWPCASSPRTYDQTSSQTCWSLQNAQSSTAFQSRGDLANATMAYCQLQTSDILNLNTTYYMRAKAIDPGGSNTYSSYSSVATFSTGTLEIHINGGTNINGGTKIGN